MNLLKWRNQRPRAAGRTQENWKTTAYEKEEERVLG
jgi:hypothetical protein